jgi:GNAT superfamily N-acetyltransferase
MAIIQRTDSSSNDFKELVKLLDADLRVKDGDDHAFYNQFNKIDAIKQVIVAYDEAIAVGCGAFKPYSEQAVEIKRMFVLPDFRGRGIAQQILKELEKWAAEMGYRSSVLETGKKQPDAIQLYLKTGYNIIPNYGQYEGVENSICMMKELN